MSSLLFHIWFNTLLKRDNTTRLFLNFSKENEQRKNRYCLLLVSCFISGTSETSSQILPSPRSASHFIQPPSHAELTVHAPAIAFCFH